ncbi:MAG: 23S rRNA (pseudouridine(1915)-N(3))-methyltransferase RlmH [Muribaculaceae bacterium]|nr:23S rRNA (pseudouridine(1915)-N(3))-methyltransferase RlmH [Muribaculaceae bacterium]
MKVQLIAIGKMNDAPLVLAVEKYVKRLVHYIPFQFITIPDIKTTRAMTEQRQKDAEGALILSSVDSRDFVILLDERGKEFTSREFAAYVDKKTLSLPGNLVFVIGGPYGFSQEVYDRANDKVSLSKMTFSHEMVRLFFVEQLYRAMTILRGEPYHHD